VLETIFAGAIVALLGVIGRQLEKKLEAHSRSHRRLERDIVDVMQALGIKRRGDDD
jgi:hypothetical protein